MSEQEQEKKKRKKKKQLSSLETERAESELFPELMKGLEELEKRSMLIFKCVRNAKVHWSEESAR
jgi:tRNA (Thr-GGU) A37 N-methylase